MLKELSEFLNKVELELKERNSEYHHRTSDEIFSELNRFRMEIQVMLKEVVHMEPTNRSNVCPCCRRSTMELPIFSRLTNDPEMVTCGRKRE